MEINVVVPQKTGNQSTLRPSYTTLGLIPKESSTIHEDICLIMVHSSFINNSQKLETTEMSLNQRINEEKNVVHLHNGVLLNC